MLVIFGVRELRVLIIVRVWGTPDVDHCYGLGSSICWSLLGLGELHMLILVRLGAPDVDHC